VYVPVLGQAHISSVLCLKSSLKPKNKNQNDAGSITLKAYSSNARYVISTNSSKENEITKDKIITTKRDKYTCLKFWKLI
jgi:hypothetical protein